MTLDEINALDREAFTIRLGGIAEGSPWVAYGAWDYRPFDGPLELVAAFRGAIARAEDERQIALIEAHGDVAGYANAVYRERFGFPFVICTHQQSPDALLQAYERAPHPRAGARDGDRPRRGREDHPAAHRRPAGDLAERRRR